MCVSKIALFGEASVLAWARGALPMCARCCGVSFFARGREKKQNKFPSNCTALSTEYKSSPSVFVIISIKFQCVVSVLHTCLRRLRIWPVAVCRLRSYPPLQMLMRGRTLKVTTSPAIGYMRCWQLALFVFCSFCKHLFCWYMQFSLNFLQVFKFNIMKSAMLYYFIFHKSFGCF